jgi:hypothetical protein
MTHFVETVSGDFINLDRVTEVCGVRRCKEAPHHYSAAFYFGDNEPAIRIHGNQSYENRRLSR